MATDPDSNPDWRTQGVVVIPADGLDSNTPQTPGMDRAAAIWWCAPVRAPGRDVDEPARTRALDDQPLECVVTRSGQDPIVINLDIEGATQPEQVPWTDPDPSRQRIDGVLPGLVVAVDATPPEEVRPMNAVSMWVLPLPVTAGRSL